MLKDMKLAWAMAALSAVPVALGVAPLAMAQTLTPPTFNWGIQQNQNPAPVSVIGYDSSTNKPCIVGSTTTCTLQTTAGSGGGGGGSTPTGTAGTPNANVVTVQGITNGTVLPISGAVTQGAGASGNPWYQTIIGPSGNQATVNSTGQLSISGPVSITGTVPVSGTFWQATQPISASSLPLPTGAALASNQTSGIFWNGATGSGSLLAANATFTGATRDLGVASGTYHSTAYYNASFYTDQAGTAYVDGSNDGSTWYVLATSALSATTPLLMSVPIVTRYYRARVVNGATAETYLWVNSSFTGA